MVAGEPVPGGTSLRLYTRQCKEMKTPPRGAQALDPSPALVLASLQLSSDSEAQITSFVESLSQGISGPRFRKLLTYVLKFVELNRSKYEQLRNEQTLIADQISSTRDELSQLVTLINERLPPVATVQRTPAAPDVAAPSATPPAAPQPTNMPALAPPPPQLPPAFQASAPQGPSAISRSGYRHGTFLHPPSRRS